MDFDFSAFRKNPAAHVHFIGCEGAGTKPLRRIFDELGFKTSGSDLTLNGHRAENLPDAAGNDLLLVYSSAVTPDNPELLEARRRGAHCILRGEALGLAAALFPCVIAVSGSHGKTSVTAMIVHILKTAGLAPGFLIGGKIRNSELTGSAGAGKIFVCEADESDGTHTAIHSSLAVVTNMEDDHVWNFDSPECLIHNFQQFAQQGKILLSPALPFFSGHPNHQVIQPPDELENDPRFRSFAHYAKIDLEIAVEAVTALELLTREEALAAAASFPGVGRRMEPHGSNDCFTLYEDYAHHPTELAESLESFRKLFPGKGLKVVFQPHRYARLERYFEDFVKVLKTADKVFITPVFAAWTASGAVDSGKLAERIGSHAVLLSGSWPEMARQVSSDVQNGDLIAVIGAGDIREIIAPLQELLFGKTALILPAGGSSARYGLGNKLFETIDGVPVFIQTIRALTGRKKYPVILPVPDNQRTDFEQRLAEFPPGTEVRLVSGGKTRTESVCNALNALDEDTGVVAVHDAARPLIRPEILEQCINAALICGGAIAAVPQTDTMKEADDNGDIIRTVPRDHIWNVQTPQVFRKGILEAACLEAVRTGRQFTDDAAAVEAFSQVTLHLVKNPYPNPKLTYPEDLALIRKLGSSNEPSTTEAVKE